MDLNEYLKDLKNLWNARDSYERTINSLTFQIEQLGISKQMNATEKEAGIGDYLSMLFQMSDDEICDTNHVYNSIGNHVYFDGRDVLSDIDALNIYCANRNMNVSVSDAVNKYYSNLNNESSRYGNFARNLMCESGNGLVLLFNTENNIPAYKDVFNKTMKGFINRDIYAAFNGALLINKEYNTNKVIKLFRDEQTIASTSSAFTDYIFDRITDFNDVYVLA